MTWAELKDLLKNNLGNDWGFANSICSKFGQDSQSQAEFVLDWVAHLDHLQSILLKYNLVGTLTEPILLKYFREGLKPSVLAELEHGDLKLDGFN